MEKFTSLNIQHQYNTLGEKQLAEHFVIPVLKHTKIYKRASAFFNSFVLETILSGVKELYNNGGRIELVISPNLPKKDVEIIKEAEDKKKAFFNLYEYKINEELFNISDDYYQLFYELLIQNVLEIKFALTNTNGFYHDKLAIFEDFYGNKISFSGSANETKKAYEENYERVKIFKSYDESSYFLNDDVEEFEKLWNDNNPDLVVISASEAIKRNVIKFVEEGKKTIRKIDSKPIPREYQNDAINSWFNNGKKGFFVMATGTGKTFTTCFGIERIFKSESPFVIIAVPYIHLIKQREEAIQKVLNCDYIIEVYGGNAKKRKQDLRQALRLKQRNKDIKVIAISTIKSWQSSLFREIEEKYSFTKLLIVDEAHKISSLIENLNNSDYQYRLGLSATPLKGRNLDDDLLCFFGGVVYNLPIEKALENNFLCKYYYHPLITYTTEEDEKIFKELTHQIMRCFDSEGNLKLDKFELFSLLKRKRNKVISMSEFKRTHDFIEKVIKSSMVDDHFIIYCGDGKIPDDDIKHLDFIKDIFDENNYRMSKFTCEENMIERMQIIDMFNKNYIDGLVSIKCLDEGIDIPSIKKAIILSSNDNFREFVQRRGRILRHYPGKESADIYDVITLPSINTPGIAEIEIRRLYEYAKLAINKDELLELIHKYINEYDLDENKIFNYFEIYEETEVEEDE